MSGKVDDRMALVLRRFPCTAREIPAGYRCQLALAERAGLAVYDGKTYRWSLTEKGREAAAR